MIVELKANSVTYTLAHGPGRGVDLHVGPADDMRNDLRRAVDSQPIIRAANVRHHNRDNRSGRMQFSIQVEKASIEAATAYAAGYPVQIPGAGELWITQDAQTTKFPDCVIEGITTTQRGVTVLITYTILYGAVSLP